MRRWTALLLTLVLALGLTACGEPVALPTVTPAPEVTTPPVEEQIFALGYDPNHTLHPITGESQANLELASLVYEGLFELNNDFEAAPVLAKSAEADESGLVWTISVREDVVFSDGTPLTAAHVVSSLKLARKSGFYAARLAEVASVKEKNGAVVITLTAPNGALPALLDIPVVLEQATAPPEDAPPLGTGRYRYMTGENVLCLMANSNRAGWENLPWLTIPLRPVESADRRVNAFDSGEISAVSADFTAAYTLGYSCSYEVCDYPTTNLIYVGFQTEKGPCQSVEVRKACSMAFHREELVSSLLAGRGDASCLPVHPNHESYDADPGRLTADPEGALELLLNAGYKRKDDGLLYQGRTPMTLTIAVNRDGGAKVDMAQVLADSLSALGFTVTVKNLIWTDYLKALETGDFDLYIGEIRMTGDFDVTQLLTGTLNYGKWVSEEAPALLAEWKAAQGENRTAAASRLWEVLAEEAPIAPLCFKQDSLLVRWGMVSGLSPTRGDLFHEMESWHPVK